MMSKPATAMRVDNDFLKICSFVPGALPAPLGEGVHPITVQVSVGTESDLLASEVDVHADEPTVRTASSSAPWLASLATIAPRTIGAFAAVIAGAIAALFILRARRARGSLK